MSGETVPAVRFHRISAVAAEIFTALHLPRGTPMGAPVLLCGGVGRAGAEAEPMLRSLASLLARGGRPAMRFDLSCTGESGGQCEDASVPQWLADIRAADAELRSACAVPRCVWFGLAAGANLMLAAACQHPPLPELLILLEPFVDREDDDGRAVLPLSTAVTSTHPAVVGTTLYHLQPGTVDVGGFPMTQALLANLRALGLRSLPALPDVPVVLLSGASDGVDDFAPGLAAGVTAALRVVRIGSPPGQPPALPRAQRFAPRTLASAIEEQIGAERG